MFFDTWHWNDLVIKCSGLLEDLTAIKVKDKVLDSSNYTLASGSTILTLKNSYLNSLDSGTYEVTLEYGDEIVNATFIIADGDTYSKSDVPKTGDNIITYVIIFVVSLIILSVGVIYQKKK